MLPALYFIFTRKGCDAAVQQCLREGVVLTNSRERKEIRELAEARCAYLDGNDLDVLGYDEWLEGLANGVAAHHAGLIPVFKETVEELFKAGLVRLTFATETLSLGINMPARTVVIESLNKFTGERHELLTPGQFTQLTGRAGRRGIDIIGHAVVPQQPEVPFKQIAGLALTSSYPLISSFQPSYNMATNLVRNYYREEAEHLLNSSFAQYRTDKEVVVVEQLVDRNAAYLASYREKMRCDRGDFEEYWKLSEKLIRLELSVKAREAENERDRIRRALAAAAPGQVWAVRTSRVQRAGRGDRLRGEHPGRPEADRPDRHHPGGQVRPQRAAFGPRAAGHGRHRQGGLVDAALEGRLTARPRTAPAARHRAAGLRGGGRARGVDRARAGAGRGRRAARGADAADPAPLPLLPGPGASRPLGGASLPAGEGEREPPQEGPVEDRDALPQVRARFSESSRSTATWPGLPAERQGAGARPDLQRERPAGLRVPQPGLAGRAWSRRSWPPCSPCSCTRAGGRWRWWATFRPPGASGPTGRSSG